ncbi:hypothetical protein KAR50_06605 [Periweissella fabaria]|uniref:Lipoprotein n=1 Tax=Periweissella fabaria TaxID=546157 RepID=A0ABN8BKQ1_9LACO|nr:YgdI/YgdR family lipoprotein [Periweissella fabaria]MCM0597512.1 hypothetical protein [Periweissella fabaria]CAH0415984.1 hypothetical protein WFA24289_00283 [Periweissella fabaria]
MLKKLLLIPLAATSGLLLAGCGSSTLDGSYKGHLNLIGTRSTETLEFNGHHVTALQNGAKTGETGTYVLNGKQVKLNIDNAHMTFNVTNHGNDLVVTDADGIKALAHGTPYLKIAGQ